MNWFIIIWTEMLIGNFSFAILIVGIIQAILMILNYKPKPKILKLEQFLIDPNKVLDIKIHIDKNKKSCIELEYDDKLCPKIFLYNNSSVKKIIRKYKQIYKKIYRRKNVG